MPTCFSETDRAMRYVKYSRYRLTFESTRAGHPIHSQWYQRNRMSASSRRVIRTKPTVRPSCYSPEVPQMASRTPDRIIADHTGYSGLVTSGPTRIEFLRSTGADVNPSPSFSDFLFGDDQGPY